MIVRDDGEIVLTDTGSISRPTLISFSGRNRLIGEEALPRILDDSTIPMFNNLLGKGLSQTSSSPFFSHKTAMFSEENEKLTLATTYCEKKSLFSTAVAGMFFAKQWERIVTVCGSDVKVALSVPHGASESTRRAHKEAAVIGGIPAESISIVDSSDALVTAYARKFSALRGADQTNLENKHIVLVDVGHTQTTTVLVVTQVNEDKTTSVKKVAVANSDELGAYHFDLNLFAHFASVCQTRTGTQVSLGNKRGSRLMAGCERLRKLLSQLPEGQITVENLTDAGDMNFSLKRDEFAKLSATLLEKFQQLLTQVVTDANLTPADISAIEIVGGGSRMPILQDKLRHMFGELPLGAKLDDSAVAVGAALTSAQRSAASSPTPDDVASTDDVKMEVVEESKGFTAEELAALRADEVSMQAVDLEIKEQLAAKNEMESYILEMRSAPRRKHGQLIDSSALTSILDTSEEWMWDNSEATMTMIREKFQTLKQQCDGLCKAYFEAVEDDRRKVEEALQEEAARAAAERELDPDAQDEDHDTRKLKKPERMRLVMKNKEEGTELFKGGNIRPAAARYQKALTHAAKFFDLSPEDNAEVNAVKCTLFLNLVQCYLKLENWELVIRNCEEALKLEPNNVKALYRRSVYYEHKKDWDKALQDIKQCQKLCDTEDKLVTKAAERISKEINKEKSKEKKMWTKAFA